MSEKKSRNANSEASSYTNVAAVDQSLDDILRRIPTQQRKELEKQYELPEIKVSIFTILRYATYFEFGLQLVGLLMAIVAGIISYPTSLCLGLQ